MKVWKNPHRRGVLTGLTILGLAAAGVAAQADAPSPFVGSFLGTLQVESVALRLKLVIAADLTAILYSVDQGNAAIPASTVTIVGQKIDLAFAAVGATFTGTRNGDHITGTFTQGGRPLPLDFARGDAFAADPLDGPLTQGNLAALRAKAGTPAFGAAWNRKGQPTKILVDGVRSSDSAVAVTAGDQWHLGSLTKAMTATLVARCIEGGLLSWTMTIGEVLGAKVPDMNPAYKTVGILHLLSHRGGLQPNIDLADMRRFSRDALADPRPERLSYAALALRQAPIGPAGAQMAYSNNGYIVVGAMLEVLTGQSWESLITERVFQPLQLTSAGFGAPGSPGKRDEPLGHSIAADGRRVPAFLGTDSLGMGAVTDNPVALGPAGRVHMSLGDLITWLEVHRDQPADFLTPENWQILHTPPFGGNYALGWVALPDGSLWHNGSNTLWYADVLIDFADGLVVATTANDASGLAGGPGKTLLSAKRAALA